MSEPIKIVLTAETAAAAQKLRDFLTQAGGGLEEVAKAGKHSEGVFMANKMAIMELEHSARSLADGLISGINPMRMMAMEGPRLMQAGTMMTEEFKTKLLAFLPILGGVGAAIGVGAIAWHFYGDALVDPTKRARELADALQKIPDILKQIDTAQRAGVVSPDEAKKYQDMLSGKTPLYNQTTVPDGFGGHALTSRPEGNLGAIGGTPVPMLTTEAVSTNHVTGYYSEDPAPGVENSYDAGAVPTTNQPANQTDINSYVQYQMRKAGVTDMNNETPAQTAALAELHEAELKFQRDSLVGIDKQIARIQDRFELERRELALKHEIAQGSPNYTSGDEEEYQQAIDASTASEAASVAEERQKQEDELARKQVEAQRAAAEQANKDREAAYKAGTMALEGLEAEITYNQQQQGALRGQFAHQEYQQRFDLLNSLYEQGNVSEQEYLRKLIEAQNKATAATKEYQAELEKVAALKQEIARGDLESRLKQIGGDPFSTQSEKDAQSIPLLQQLQDANQQRINALTKTANTTTDETARLEAEKQITALLGEQAQLQDRIFDAQKTQSATVAFGTMFAKLHDEADISFSTLATAFQNTFNTAVGSISQNFTKLIEGTETWRKALMNISNTILNEIIGSIVQMGVRWLLTQAVMALGGRSIMAAAVAASAPIAAAQAAIWTAPAVMATIGTLGAAAVAAPGFIGIAEAESLGLSAFAAGGRPDVGVPSLVGEEGPELFIPDSAGTIIPAGQTAQMLNASPRPLAGAGSAAGGGASALGNQVSVYSFMDKTEMQNHLEQNDAHEKWVVGVMGRNVHKLR